MNVGIPCEVKSDEYRVGMQPVGVEILTRRGHRVLLEAGAGIGAGFPDELYAKAAIPDGCMWSDWSSGDA